MGTPALICSTTTAADDDVSLPQIKQKANHHHQPLTR